MSLALGYLLPQYATEPGDTLGKLSRWIEAEGEAQRMVAAAINAEGCAGQIRDAGCFRCGHKLTGVDRFG